MKQCKKLIYLSLHHKMPHDLSEYLLTSLYRINDGEYAEKVKALVDTKHSKRKDYYYNPSNKGGNKKK